MAVVREGLAVAVPAFRRPDLLRQALASLDPKSLSEVFVSIDGPRGDGDHEAVLACQEVAHEYASSAQLPVRIRHAMQNVGAAVNVISAIDWMLVGHNWGSIIEDDCFASPQFFSFAMDMLRQYESDRRVWMVCGSQFAPPDLIHGTHVFAHFPLTWGWALTRSKWVTMRRDLVSSLDSPGQVIGGWRSLLDSNARYWNAGHRRAAQGFVDAWDMPLVAVMQASDALCVLPAVNLVTNVGDDERATHTEGRGEQVRRPVGTLAHDYQLASDEDAQAMDAWLRHDLFRIRGRHLASTRVTEVLDKFRHAPRQPLAARLANAPQAFHEVTA